MESAVVRISGIERRYREVAVLRDCSFTVGAAETILLLGANGAGKSTLLRVIAGLARPSAGSVEIHPAAAPAVRLAAHEAMLYGELSVEENFRLFAALRGHPADCDLSSLDEWLLGTERHKSINQLSKGQRAKAALASVFAGTSPVLLLDEPSSALDDAATEVLCRAVHRERERGAAVLIATHDLARLGRLASRILILDHGKIGFDSAADSGPDAGGSAADAISRGIARYRELNR